MDGTSLLKAFKSTNKRVFSIFGCPENMEESRNMYPDGKYTSDFVVERAGSPGEFYSIYRCYGEWRVGGVKEFCPHLGELLECIAPARHKGWARLRPEVIFCEGLHADKLSSVEELQSHYSRRERAFDPPRVCAPVHPVAVSDDDELPF
jgi:hypothetical protein